MEKIEGGVQRIMMDEDMDFIDSTESTKNKIIEAQELIESSKELVDEVDFEVEECKVCVSKAAEDFDTQKRIFINETLKVSEELLEKVGFECANNESSEPFELSIDSAFEGNLSIDYISSGRFTGMILAIIASGLTLFGWIYLASQKLNIPLENLSLKAIETNINTVLIWIGGGIFDMEGHAMIGALIIGFSILLMAWFVYAIRVHFKAHKNLRIAKRAYVESKEYSLSQDECKKEILKVDGHLRESIVSIENFGIILNEQNAILKRVVHIEGIASEDHRYHPNSTRVMRETQRVMKSIETLLNTSITKNGKLNLESQKALSISKAVYEDFIARIYG